MQKFIQKKTYNFDLEFQMCMLMKFFCNTIRKKNIAELVVSIFHIV